jgi:hypothetical protein
MHLAVMQIIVLVPSTYLVRYLVLVSTTGMHGGTHGRIEAERKMDGYGTVDGGTDGWREGGTDWQTER